jgi:hypothetical protein
MDYWYLPRKVCVDDVLETDPKKPTRAGNWGWIAKSIDTLLKTIRNCQKEY